MVRDVLVCKEDFWLDSDGEGDPLSYRRSLRDVRKGHRGMIYG